MFRDSQRRRFDTQLGVHLGGGAFHGLSADNGRDRDHGFVYFFEDA